MRTSLNALIVGLIGCLAFSASSGAAVTLTPIPFSPLTLSGDGSTVYGSSGSNFTGVNLLRWTAAGGVQIVGQFPAHYSVTIWSSSDDGSVVAGTLRPDLIDLPNQPPIPYVWRAGSGLQTFPTATDAVRCFVSGNGNVAVSDGFHLTPGPVTAFPYTPRGINGDGSIVGVGGAFGPGIAARVVNGVKETIAVPEQSTTIATSITAVTPDGVCLGYTTDGRIFLWQANQIQTLPTIPTGWQPNDISDDGRIIVGHGLTSGQFAFMIIDGRQVRVRNYLIEQGVDVSGYSVLDFQTAWNISHDGTKFISQVKGTQGVLVTIPEPSLIGLLAIAGPSLLISRRRRTAKAQLI